MKIDALGFVELLGYIAAIEAADAMLKTADVRLLAVHEVNPGLITVQVEGNLAACRVAVNAGRAAAERVGTVIATHVIGRPDPDTEAMVSHHLGHGGSRNATSSETRQSSESGQHTDTPKSNRPNHSTTPARPTPRKKAQGAVSTSTVVAVAKARQPRSTALPKEQVKKLKADKQGKAMAQAARQWADALLGEMGAQDTGHESTADQAPPIQRPSKSKRAAVKK